MPQRTNDFQRLITLIEEQLAGPETKVTPSAFLTSLEGTEREADILVETIVNGRSIKIVVECRDYARKNTIEWIDGLCGKYDSRVNQIIAVARNGFTPEALKKAEARGIMALTLEEACDENWKMFLSRMYIRLVTHDTHLKICIMSPPGSNHERKEGVLDLGNAIFRTSKRKFGTAQEIFFDFLDSPVGQQWMRENAEKDECELVFKIRMPSGTYVRTLTKQRMKVTAIGFEATMRKRVVEKRMTPASYSKANVGTLVADWDGDRLVGACTLDSTDGSVKVAVAGKTSKDSRILGYRFSDGRGSNLKA